MSNLREKADQIKAEGEATRGTFEPQGTPKRLYQYWLSESNSKRARSIRGKGMKENFCHFWRVVAIWAPLMFLRRKAEQVAPYVGIALAVAAAIGLIWLFATTSEAWAALGIVVVGGLGAAAIMGLAALYESLVRKHAKNPDKVFSWTFGVLLAVPLGGLFVLINAIAISNLGWGLAVIYLAIGLVALAGWYFVPRIARWMDAEEEAAQARSRAAWDAYYNGEGPKPGTKKEPNKFIQGFKDFMHFIAQVSRANKWKICPLVDIDTKENYR